MKKRSDLRGDERSLSRKGTSNQRTGVGSTVGGLIRKRGHEGRVTVESFYGWGTNYEC